MSYFPGDSDVKSILIDLLRNTPSSPGKRRAIIRLLWNEAAGKIISQHVTIRRCHDDGRIAVEVDDSRWMQPIRDSARLILQRINTALNSMHLEEYMVHGLDIFPAPPTKPRKPSSNAAKAPAKKIPAHMEKRIKELPESLRGNFRKWYLSAHNQESKPDPEN